MSPLLASGVYFGAVLAVAELARRTLEVPSDVTRRSVWAALGLLPLLVEPRSAAPAYVALAAFLYLSFRFELFRSIEDDGPGPGSVLAPLSMALLLFAFGKESPHVALSGIFALGFGDGAAAVVGRRLGTRKYRTLGHPRTMEGTLACFLASSASAAPVLSTVGGLDGHQAVAFALISGTVAASLEAISIYGTDNATVPVGVAATLRLLTGASGQ